MAETEVLELGDDIPEPIDLEELQYRLFLRQELAAAEAAVRARRTLSHEEVVREAATGVGTVHRPGASG